MKSGRKEAVLSLCAAGLGTGKCHTTCQSIDIRLANCNTVNCAGENHEN